MCFLILVWYKQCQLYIVSSMIRCTQCVAMFIDTLILDKILKL